MKTSYRECEPYITRDGSSIRELMHPAVHDNCNQSLAEASVAPGQRTHLHRHLQTEEIYHVTAGNGVMQLGGHTFEVAAGDTVYIAPGEAHCLINAGETDLRVLCACAPAYSHDDTELLDDDAD